MCKFCLKHGAGRKWYENVRNYSKELYEELNATGWTMDHWRLGDKVYAESSMGLGRMLDDPVATVGLREMTTEMLHKDSGPRMFPEGHVCQVVTLEEGKNIVKLAGPIMRSQCYCRKFVRNKTENVCLNFFKHAEVAEMFPDHVPRGMEKLSTEEAIAFLEECNERGLVHNVTGAPIPYVAALCNCSLPECGILRPKVDLGIGSNLKGHYVSVVDIDECTGCKICLSRCQFGAIQFSHTLGRALVNQLRCFGCGLCATACPEGAIRMVPRQETSILSEVW